jgi:putative ABC transport system ATP-binding protein
MVTHSREVADGAQRLVRMRDGRILLAGEVTSGSVEIPAGLRVVP